MVRKEAFIVLMQWQQVIGSIIQPPVTFIYLFCLKLTLAVVRKTPETPSLNVGRSSELNDLRYGAAQ